MSKAKVQETEEPERTNAKDLSNYLGAVVAGRISSDPSRRGYTIESLRVMYNATYGDVIKRIKADPIIGGELEAALGRAEAGLASGHITDAKVLESIGFYSELFKKAYESARVSELIEAFSTDDLKEDTIKVLSLYQDKTIKEIEDKEHQKIVAQAFGMQTEYKQEEFAFKLVKASRK